MRNSDTRESRVGASPHRQTRPRAAGAVRYKYLLYVPGGAAAYACCIRDGTTLPFDPDEIHRLGLAALAEIEEQIGELGHQLMGASDVRDVTVRLRRTPR
jgi:uncharacterized protein (DUF885 family)